MQEILTLIWEWCLSHGIKVVLILLAAWMTRRLVHTAVAKLVKKFKQEGITQSESEKRAKTLGGIIKAFATVVISAVAAMMVITEFGVEIGPLLAGAGIAGLAIGFGAQTLVKDVINGFFMLLEDQIRVGDVVNIAGIGGLVEAVNLRTTRLRDLEGRVHIIPNSSIDVTTNLTREWSRALIDIGVAYKEDVDRVISTMKEVGEEMMNDPAYSNLILEPLTVLGVDSFGDSSVNIKTFFKTVPLKQWDVAREYRRRIKRVFDEKGIEIPFPHRTIYIGEAENKGKLKVEATLPSTAKQTHLK